MKTCSKAIQTALKKYNDLAIAMDPPAPTLEWKDLTNYAFVAELDLLHHIYSHRDITQLPWALQLNREVTSKYFKIKCAQDEIIRFNVECRRLLTHMRYEEAHYLCVIAELTEGSPELAAAVRRSYDNRRRANRVHRRLDAIFSLEGFTGLMTAGRRAGDAQGLVNNLAGGAQQPAPRAMDGHARPRGRASGAGEDCGRGGDGGCERGRECCGGRRVGRGDRSYQSSGGFGGRAYAHAPRRTRPYDESIQVSKVM